jgi:nucleoside-diphosphate-sugar epimerase
LVAALLRKGHITTSDGKEGGIDKIIVSDVAEPLCPLPSDPRLETVYGDCGELAEAGKLISETTGAVFHLAAIVSGEAEQNFDLGMRVNLHGTERILETCRTMANNPRFVFASSVAVYGGDMPEVIDDHTALTPQTSYGSQKAMCELLVNDYTRKGFVDGRALRLPTVIVRPGKPNKAASSFASSILREPLEGREVVCPVSKKTGVWVLSPRRVVDCFMHAEALPADTWGTNRTLCLPGLTVSVEAMMGALGDVAGDVVAARVRFESDELIEKIVYGWPTRLAPNRSLAMGFRADQNVRDIIEAFIEDDLDGQFVR